MRAAHDFTRCAISALLGSLVLPLAAADALRGQEAMRRMGLVPEPGVATVENFRWLEGRWRVTAVSGFSGEIEYRRPRGRPIGRHAANRGHR